MSTKESHDGACDLIVMEAGITGMGACGRSYTITSLSGTGSTKRALGKGGTALGGVPLFPKTLAPTERMAILTGCPSHMVYASAD